MDRATEQFASKLLDALEEINESLTWIGDMLVSINTAVGGEDPARYQAMAAETIARLQGGKS